MATDLDLHAWQRAGLDQPPHGFEHRIEQAEQNQRKIVGGQKPAPSVQLGGRNRGFYQNRLQPTLKIRQKLSIPQIGGGQLGFGFGASARHETIKLKSGSTS